MKLLSLFGLGRPLRRLRIAAAESALAAEDRVQLLRALWDEEKQRLQWMIGLAIAVTGLTTVAAALLSVAVIVHFWDTAHRATAAWSVAVVWIVLWVAALAALITAMRKTSEGLAPARDTFERDWRWVRHRLKLGGAGKPAIAVPPLGREELLARIERQRQRVATVDAPAPAAVGAAAAPPVDESAGASALRIAKAHPIATGAAAAAAVVVLGPSRLLRWVAVIAPILWRMRG